MTGHPDELADLLAAGERAAFHGPPGAGVDPLRSAAELAASQGRTSEGLLATWLLGVTLGASGRYGSALSVLEPLGASCAPGDDSGPEARLIAALAAATAASVHRQLGRHAAATQRDQHALALALAGEAPAEGLDEPAFDARLGLAADAVGLGDAAEAHRRLDEAAGVAAAHPQWWRQRVRLDWVRAEIALLEGEAAPAVRAAQAALALSERSGAPRHTAKSLLFVGVSLLQDGQLAEGAAALRRAGLLAEGLGALPLVWPSRAMLGALVAESDPGESARALASARSAVLALAEDLSEELRAEWLSRPDIAALLGTG